MGCRTEKFGAAALLFTFLSYHEPPEISIYFKFVFITQTQNTVFGTFFRICPFVVSIKKVNKSAISRKGDGYGIGTGNKIP